MNTKFKLETVDGRPVLTKSERDVYVRVLPHEVYQYLVGNAVVSRPRVHQHPGYARVRVVDVLKCCDDDLSHDAFVVEVEPGLFDEVPRKYCVTL